METDQFAEHDPRHYTTGIKATLHDTITQARDGVGKIEEPKAQALLETTAEVNGLLTAYEHYERKTEAAWK